MAHFTLRLLEDAIDNKTFYDPITHCRVIKEDDIKRILDL